MKAWDVEIVATIRKTIRITEDQANNKEDATELARSLFNTSVYASVLKLVYKMENKKLKGECD